MTKQLNMPTVRVGAPVYLGINDAKARMWEGQKDFDPSETEQSGYVSPQKQIENMMLAGQRLDIARREMYDFGDESEIDEDLYDPTRSNNYDLSDASQDLLEIESNIKRHKASPKASQTAQEAPEDVQTSPEGGNEPPPEKGA